ncbi:MAG: hypothetical protein OHK0029_19010 [Armatimonadaceae bacterium]
MVEIEVSKAELETGELNPAHLRAAKDALFNDGFVVLKNVVDTAHLDILHERMLEDVKALISRKDAPFNWNVGNVQQDPPPFPPYLFRDVLLNDMVISVSRAVLGDGIKNTMYGGNTAMPSEHRQPVHADTGHLWPELEVAHPPVHLVVNIPVVNMSAENGSTEIWPGTHKDITITAGMDIKIPAEVLERRRAEVPPLQPTVAKGSVLIRDMRLWHAGMPNRTDHPRPMIAMIHVPHWLETDLPLRFPQGTESFFEHPHLRTCARFVEEPIDHISAPHGHEYNG